ncbi:hypothetical protein [Kutzneria kofuensis]|uniref:Uncharacterized protein n=1 Tax=Kutzneria kofuensis TaxID=103725 RepID=A0A7W9KQU6_9PSEU|nr:hypothetical protein [Kutzneria kofuensis]MBB5896952.1 hypothetical protein [Kutzneria kofuensis]
MLVTLLLRALDSRERQPDDWAVEVRELLGRLTGRFDSGELIFDGVAPWLAGLTAWPAGSPGSGTSCGCSAPEF